MKQQQEPKLAPPGAGLPAIELLVARLLFAIRVRLTSREASLARFQREREMIAAFVEGCPAEQRGERVLVSRSAGLEDSSRNWSVWMTLDHLRITNTAFGTIIPSLAKGVVPQGKASTAAVKPDPNVTASVENAYEQSCESFLSAVSSVRDLRTTARFAHPWFGPLDGFQWLALAAMHMGIHRKQIQRIMAGLR